MSAAGSCWSRILALKREADELSRRLDACGWSLAEPFNGQYVARRRGGRRDVWREVRGRTPEEVMSGVSAETQRIEAEKAERARRGR